MGLIVRVFGCDKCGHQWELMQDRDDPPPEACPACAKRKKRRQAIPATKAMGRRLKSKSVDSVYRAMEEGSAFRAEKTGNKQLKITDMKSGVRPGETVAPRVNNEVSRMLDAKGGPWQGGIAGTGLTTQQLVAQTRASEGKWAIDAVRGQHRAGVLPPANLQMVRDGARAARRSARR